MVSVEYPLVSDHDALWKQVSKLWRLRTLLIGELVAPEPEIHSCLHAVWKRIVAVLYADESSDGSHAFHRFAMTVAGRFLRYCAAFEASECAGAFPSLELLGCGGWAFNIEQGVGGEGLQAVPIGTMDVDWWSMKCGTAQFEIGKDTTVPFPEMGI